MHFIKKYNHSLGALVAGTAIINFFKFKIFGNKAFDLCFFKKKLLKTNVLLIEMSLTSTAAASCYNCILTLVRLGFLRVVFSGGVNLSI